jgi:hypothetical protein
MTLEQIAAKHGFSVPAAQAALDAVRYGGGTQAQFSHPELGGMGQWQRGGMIMIGDMFNNNLKYRVSALLEDLCTLPAPPPPAPGTPGFAPAGGGNWWPGDLGFPSSTGGQNNSRYAYFPDRGRLVTEDNGYVTVYDTTGITVYGFGQQQPGPVNGLTLSTSNGQLRPTDLRTV